MKYYVDAQPDLKLTLKMLNPLAGQLHGRDEEEVSLNVLIRIWRSTVVVQRKNLSSNPYVKRIKENIRLSSHLNQMDPSINPEISFAYMQLEVFWLINKISYYRKKIWPYQIERNIYAF